jgi:7-cyano-7-deazaguanine synthase
MPERSERGDVAVLTGGADSAVLAVELLGSFDRVFPLYIRFGLRWERTEQEGLEAFLKAVARPGLEALRVLDEPMSDVYGEHWSTDGGDVPDADTPDSAVYLPGRNLLLVAKAAAWCSVRGVRSIALGSLASNPFPDSTPEFDRDLEAVLDRAFGSRITLLRPFAELTKSDVLRRGSGLPLWLTFSCLQPVEGRHCGHCNKCAERRMGFRMAGRPDRTLYAAARTPVPCIE